MTRGKVPGGFIPKESGDCCVDIGVTSDTIVGKGTKMDNFVQIGHDAKLGKNCFLGAHASVGGVTRVEDNVSIWAMGAVNKDLIIAEGTTELYNLTHIDRGYEKLEEKLSLLGANIKRVEINDNLSDNQIVNPKVLL